MTTRLALLLTLLAALFTAPASAHAAPPEADDRWFWPSGDPVPIAASFDPPEVPWAAGHRGVDLAFGEGEPVRAPADGVVVYAGQLVDRTVISIRHAGGIRSTYERVDPLVSVGAAVVRGQVIGFLSTGRGDGVLHWGAKFDDRTYVDPLLLVLGEPVLKPWDAPGGRSG